MCWYNSWKVTHIQKGKKSTGIYQVANKLEIYADMHKVS